MDYSEDRRNPIKTNGGIQTEYAAAALVIGALAALIMIRRGFRGVGVPGLGSVGVGR